MDIKIYIPYHKAFPVKLESEIFTPIHVWKKLSNINLNIIWDDSWDNISNLNKEFCELTAMYWVWKNQIKTDYIWFFHYRRFLWFEQKTWNKTIDILNKIWLLKLISSNPYRYSFETNSLKKDIEWYDIILPKTKIINKTIFDSYKEAHYEKDLIELSNIIKKKFPNYWNSVDKIFFKKNNLIFSRIHLLNIFIMKQVFFNEYMNFLFSCLFELKNKINIDNYDDYQKRFFWFLAERMLDVYIDFKNKDKKLKIKELPIIFIN